MRRMRLRWPGSRRREQGALLLAALEAADRGWPVVPGARAVRGVYGPCTCGEARCPLAGAHPHDPPLAAATTDGRMVQWWWEHRAPGAPVVAATGRSLCAVSLPAAAGERVLRYFADVGVPVGPVLASPGRYALLVAPFTLEDLGGLLAERPWVPGSLRYHGPGGYVLLPPSQTGAGGVHWVSPPAADALWLPQVGALLEGLIAASVAEPDGSRLAY
ncbi:bifunctional DNA primase/polymerase-like protein [Streptomyces sp. TLI_235]|nr:bifunctional DNA primase/polymerase [Streptomyces sp. TLI_235]PBC78794.1 bifunctional DNA primase/polymerase-like protein [Streptomyces sp. TLI_235]